MTTHGLIYPIILLAIFYDIWITRLYCTTLYTKNKKMTKRGFWLRGSREQPLYRSKVYPHHTVTSSSAMSGIILGTFVCLFVYIPNFLNHNIEMKLHIDYSEQLRHERTNNRSKTKKNKNISRN
ncbi:hypothetical protein HanHA89_Chr03g0111581 [Helianthus annuus]|nr:hypothetical protein HanHA89_Chr03g0111581 [Helianthus annuus]